MKVAGKNRANRPFFFHDVDGNRVEFPALGEGSGDLEGVQLAAFNAQVKGGVIILTSEPEEEVSGDEIDEQEPNDGEHQEEIDDAGADSGADSTDADTEQPQEQAEEVTEPASEDPAGEVAEAAEEEACQESAEPEAVLSYAERYQAITGKKPDGRWSDERLATELEKLEG